MKESNKMFYWIKLSKDLMNGEAIDFLMSQKGGSNYVVLYQMLIIKTINTEGQLCSSVGELIIPYDVEKIQRECKWFDLDTIRVAMELYSKLNLIYKGDNGILRISNFEELVGSETYWAKRKRIQREVVGQCPTNVQNPLISNISISNISKSNKDNKFKKPTVEEIKEYCLERKNKVDAERFYDFYESKGWKVGKNSMKDWKACVRTWEKSNNNFNSNKREIEQKIQTREHGNKNLGELFDDLSEVEI